LTKSSDVFAKTPSGSFDYKTFITAYLGIPVYLILIFGYKFFTKSKGVNPYEADLWTGKDIIDREEAAFLEKQAARSEKQQQYGWFYNKFVSWLF